MDLVREAAGFEGLIVLAVIYFVLNALQKAGEKARLGGGEKRENARQEGKARRRERKNGEKTRRERGRASEQIFRVKSKRFLQASSRQGLNLQDSGVSCQCA